jgi:hypothetical protein
MFANSTSHKVEPENLHRREKPRSGIAFGRQQWMRLDLAETITNSLTLLIDGLPAPPSAHVRLQRRAQ